MRSSYAAALCVVLAAAYLAGAASLSLEGAPGYVGDPAGDSSTWQGSMRADITGVSVDKVGEALRFRAVFANMQPNTYVGFCLDADREPTTGLPGVSSDNSDAGIIGMEYYVRIWPRGISLSQTQPWTNLAKTGATLTTFDNGYEAIIPLACFHCPDGQFADATAWLNYKAVSFVKLDTVFYTTVLDYGPDLGLPAATSFVPEPATLLLLGFGGLLATRRRHA